MKLGFKWPSGFCKKLCLNMLMGLQYERSWLETYL